MTTEARDGVPPSSLEQPLVVALSAAAVFLGYALNIYNGTLPDRRDLSALCAAIACSAAAVFLRRVPLGAAVARLRVVLIAAAVLYGGYALLTQPPVVVPGGGSAAVQLAIGVAIVLAVTALLPRPPLGRLHVPLLLAVYIAAGVFVIHRAAVPSIDVYQFHKEGLNALLAGRSPYSTSIPNLYGSSASHFYGASLVADGRVEVGYPYPPLNLFLALPGRLAGDYRYALVAAIVIAAGLIAGQHPGPSARAGAALLLFCPKVFFVCEQGWTEPFVAVTLAAVMFCAVRARRMLPFALAALLASKQYAVLTLPAIALLCARPGTSPAIQSAACGRQHGDLGRPPDMTSAVRLFNSEFTRIVASAVALACAVSLPFVVADRRGFVDSVLLFQLRQPFRPEALSLLGKVPGGLNAGSGLGLVAALTVLAACLWRAARSAGGFAGSVALVFLVFFAFAKQAFWNYYFLVFAAMACAVGAFDSEA